MIQNLHFEKVSIWLQIDRNPYMVADNRELRDRTFARPHTPTPGYSHFPLYSDKTVCTQKNLLRRA